MTTPAWAAPEWSERLSHQWREGPVLDSGDMIVIRALNDGLINPYQFQTAWRLSVASRRETSGWTEEDWVRWERENPE